MTFVEGPSIRPVGFDSFADITELEVVSFEGGVTFDGALTPEQVAQVRARMTSRDDADQTARANLAALRTAAAAPTATTDDVKALALAVSAYLLGIEAP